MTIFHLKTRAFSRCFNLLATISFILIAFVGSADAQSTDPDNPTPMTTNEVKGRWARGSKAFSHFYSFVAGPGEVQVMFYFVTDEMMMQAGGQLLDASGLALTELNAYEQKSSQLSYDLVYGLATEAGVRLVSRFNVKRRQKLTIRAFSALNNSAEWGGWYKIHVEGGNPSFTGDAPPTNPGNSATHLSANTTGSGISSLPCLPKSGKLRFVMNDGTIEEINLSNVREVMAKP